MPRQFTALRLLLVFIAINTVMMLMLVTSMASQSQWLTRFLPGDWSPGHSTGLWVFFSLVFLVNAVVVLLAGVITILPAIGRTDERYQLLVGRIILLVGAVFCVVAFGGVTKSFAKALPEGEMFRSVCESPEPLCATPGLPRAIPNAAAGGIMMFTLDELASAVLLDAPEIYGFRLSAMSSNPRDAVFTNFTFSFRVVMVLSALLFLMSFLPRPRAAAATPAADA